MPERGHKLEEWEIALIKAMLGSASFTKQEILAYFSRPDRPINQGRVSEISSGKRHGTVPAATPEQLQAFLHGHSNPASARELFFTTSPLHPVVLAANFRPRTDDPDSLDLTENDWTECKQSLNWNSLAAYGRTMAAFANNRGGYLVFGVHDSTKKLSGIPKMRLAGRDPALITQPLNRWFSPALRWDMHETTINGKNVGFIYVWISEDRPVICTQDSGSDLKAGDIYYRYPGLTTRVRYPELSQIFRIREKKIEDKWMSLLSRVRTEGIENVAIMNTLTGKVDGPAGSFLIDENLLPTLKFIREGNFSEYSGAPTLKLIGSLEPIKVGKPHPVKAVVTKDIISDRDILEDFIEQKQSSNPRAYIRQYSHATSIWLPIYYWIRQADISVEEAVNIIKKEKTSHQSIKKRKIARIAKLQLRTGRASPSSVLVMRETIFGKKWIDTSDANVVKIFLRTVETLRSDEIDLEYLLPILKECFDRYYAAPSSNLIPQLRYATSHVDTQVFGLSWTG